MSVRFFGPKGQRSKALGNAQGKRGKCPIALKGRRREVVAQTPTAEMCRPFRAECLGCTGTPGVAWGCAALPLRGGMGGGDTNPRRCLGLCCVAPSGRMMRNGASYRGVVRCQRSGRHAVRPARIVEEVGFLADGSRGCNRPDCFGSSPAMDNPIAGSSARRARAAFSPGQRPGTAGQPHTSPGRGRAVGAGSQS